MNPSDTPIMNAAMEWQDHRDLLAQIGLLERELSQVKAELAETRRLAEGLAEAMLPLEDRFQLHPNMNGGGYASFSHGDSEGLFRDVVAAREALAAWEARKTS